jgi:hypothetical protein
MRAARPLVLKAEMKKVKLMAMMTMTKVILL